jgi:hypothetical protein
MSQAPSDRPERARVGMQEAKRSGTGPGCFVWPCIAATRWRPNRAQQRRARLLIGLPPARSKLTASLFSSPLPFPSGARAPSPFMTTGTIRVQTMTEPHALSKRKLGDDHSAGPLSKLVRKEVRLRSSQMHHVKLIIRRMSLHRNPHRSGNVSSSLSICVIYTEYRSFSLSFC